MSVSDPSNLVPKNAKIPEIPDLERLQKIKSSGGLLGAIDEQRLRRHQLHKLRVKWLQDQRLSAREPLHPPLTLREKIFLKEEAFWKRVLPERTISGLLYGNRFFRELPKVLFYKTQRGARNYFLWVMIPFSIMWAGFKMHIENEPQDLVGGFYNEAYPGEKQFTAKRKDVMFNYKTLQLVPPEGVVIDNDDK